MFIIKHRNTFFALTSAIVALSLFSIFYFGLHLGIDFTGGTLAQISYDLPAPAGARNAGGQTGDVRPPAEVLIRNLEDAGFEGFSLRETGESGYTLRAQSLTPEQRDNLTSFFSYQNGSAQVDELTEIGPTIGTELRNKSLLAIALVLLCILLFIAFAFRKVSKPVSSWMYGLMAIVGLAHNIIVTLGFFALLGSLTGAQVDTLFVTAILTVLGFSVHDTIVVFDRVRENLRINQERNKREDFAETAGRSLGQTFVRSINTSLTVLFTLAVLYVVGPASTRDFSLTLLVGIVAGTYSSLFLATPLLVTVERYFAKRR
jgi:preprotein translocase subunit SecF